MLRSVRLYLDLLAEYLRPQWPLMLVLGLLMLSGIGAQLLAPQVIRYFIDTAQEQGDLNVLYATAALYLVVGLASEALSGLAIYVGRDVAWRATNRLRSVLALHVFRLDMSFHNARTPGELVERIDGDVERLANFFSQFVYNLVGGLILGIGVLVAISFEEPRVGAIMAAYAVFYLVVHTRLFRVVGRMWRKESEERASFYGFLGERLSGIKDIQTSGAVGYQMRRFHEVMRAKFRSTYRPHMFAGIAWGISNSLFSLRLVGAWAIGAYLFMSGQMTIGTVYLIIQYLQHLRGPLLAVSREMEDLQKATVAIDRVRELLATRSAIQDGTARGLPPGRVSVEFDGVSFAYHPDRPVLRDVSFRIEPGRVLGLLGRTGSGKTTISRLLFRLYDPGHGAVRLGDADVAAARLAELRGRIGMVTQDVQLFRATVRDNLTLFDPAISDEKVLASLEILGLGPWLSSMPDGLDTELANRGEQLSAGEAQLLAFARVFLRDPDVVILDEASSRLDPATERLIEQAVERLLVGRTAMIIAHRLSTIERVDEVLIIDDGAVQEHGDRRELLADPGSRLSRLMKTGLEGVLA